MERYKKIQDEVIKKYQINIIENSHCKSRTHAHVKERKICKWKSVNSINSTFTLFHEIGHIMTTKSKMRRCESEYYATVWAIEEMKKYGLKIPKKIIESYQEYIYRELERGLRKRGSNYLSKEEMKLII